MTVLKYLLALWIAGIIVGMVIAIHLTPATGAAFQPMDEAEAATTLAYIDVERTRQQTRGTLPQAIKQRLDALAYHLISALKIFRS